MTDTNRDDVLLRLDLDTLANTGSRCPTTNELVAQKRTRSQLDVSDMVLRLPLSRSPLKDARKAHVKSWKTSPAPRSDLQLNAPRTSKSPTMDCGGAEVEMETGEQKYEGDESTDSLFSPASNSGKGSREDLHPSQTQQPVWPTGTKKRPSPDADAIRVISSPGSERQSKRAKVDGLRALGRSPEHLEYCEPLRDPDIGTPARSRRHIRASSTKPTSSPTKAASTIFPPRAQSVPLGGENEVRAVDLTSIPPSPRRSPSKTVVEIRRAPSIPPPDADRMDTEVEDNSALLHFTNPTQLATPLATPVFSCTVNFATPRDFATPRSGIPLASPLSPLTPLASSPTTEHPFEMQGRLAKTNARLRKLVSNVDARNNTPTGSRLVIPPITDTAGAHVSIRSSSAAPTSRPASVILGSSGPSTDTAPQGPSLALNTTFNDFGDAEEMSKNVSTDVSSAPDSRMDLNVIPISRPSVIGSMKPKRGPAAIQNSKRVTRSVSMKEQRGKGEDGIHTSDDVNAASETHPPPEVGGIPATSTMVGSKPRLPTSTAASKSRLPLTARRSASVSKLPRDPDKLKQTSLNVFVKPKPSILASAATDSTTSTSTSNTNSSRITPLPSSSKIPLPASPSKRPLITGTKSSLFSLDSNGAGTTGTSRGPSGRSLATLSHALDKLVVPPPSRPNTSMGFVRAGGGSEESTPDTRKGKEKAKDDASLPSTFARPTASSLKRASTVSQVGSTATAKRRRSVATTGVFGRARGTIGIFGKTGDRASKKTNLPVVEGSPVKGSASTIDDADADGSVVEGTKDAGGIADDEDVFMSHSAPSNGVQDVHDASTKAAVGAQGTHKPLLLVATNPGQGAEIDLTMSPISADKGKQRAAPSTLNPASSALHALSQSLSSLPQTPTPPKQRVLGTRTGLRSSTAAVGKESPAHDGSGSAGPGENGEVHGSGGAGPSATVNVSGEVKKSSLKILKRCNIFVDVRTEQGDDAGSLFVDMLKGLGAKIMGRLGWRCTHIVYKNGHPNTLARYRALGDPKPLVVGIAWVVECVEKRARLDEDKFKVDVDMINVAGGRHKRRRSMLPKHLIPASPGPDYEAPKHMSSEIDEDEDGMDGSPSQDPDLSIRSREDDLPPLERARLRRSVLPGGQTRLVP